MIVGRTETWLDDRLNKMEAGRECEDLEGHWFASDARVKEWVVEKLRKEGSCSVDGDGR